jgi:NAD(P)-dependent dehydrogenase (short-subunit alcohol dehydrogenase family)
MIIDPLFNISQEVILITGVSGQLGNEYAKAFLQRGGRVAGLDLQQSLASDALSNQYPDNYKFFVTNVTDKTSLQRNLVDIFSSFGTPTVLINNAAIDSPPSAPPEENGAFEDYPEASWDKVINVNLKFLEPRWLRRVKALLLMLLLFMAWYLQIKIYMNTVVSVVKFFISL